MRELKVEIADTPLKRERGLMGRKRMDKDSGMLFKFPIAHKLSFWMRNTYLPLNIAFVDVDGTILQIEEMVPLSTKAVESNQPCKFALEVPQGWFETNEIGIGSTIYGSLFKNVDEYSKQVYCNYTHGRLYTISQTEPIDVPAPVPPPANIAPDDVPPEEPPPAQPDLPSMDPTEEDEPELTPSLQVLETYEQKLALAQKYGMPLVLVYFKKGLTLPPRVVSPMNNEYALEITPKGNEVVRVWDNTPRIVGPDYIVNPGEKTFLMDNIVALDFKPEDETFLRDRKEIQ